MSKSKKPQRHAATSYVKVPPNAARTLSAMRDMGYDSYSAVMDLVDNSIDAGATQIEVTVREVGKSPVIDILDNGRGMDDATLTEALKLGSMAGEYDPAKRLGKYGMGLVTASISLARNVWILTRGEGKGGYEAVFDLDTIERENDFVISLKAADSKRVVEHLGHTGGGTLVRLSRIDRIEDTNVSRFSAVLKTRMGRVFRHFIKAGMTLKVNNRIVAADDPLMLDHPETETVLDTKLDLGDGSKARLLVVELPDLGTQGDAEAGIFPHTSGFYVVRNQREIIAASTFGIYRHHHSYSHFRAEISYSGESSAFRESVKKDSIHPDDKLVDRIRELTKKAIEDSGRRSRESGERPMKLTHKAAQAVINDRFAVLAAGPTSKDIEAAKALALAGGDMAPLLALAKPAAEEPKRKRGRPTKEEAEKRKAEEAAKPEAPALPKPAVQFIEVDGGDKGRFFTAETQGKDLVIAYNTRHPLVRLVAEAQQPKVHAVLDMMAFALAKAEGDVPEGKKLVNRACDYLAVLAAPQAR
jgi:hypothetical protein